MTDGVSPITLEERQARLARAQKLMAKEGLDAVVLAAGTNLGYFSGASWRNSERFFGMVLTQEGEPAWVTPAFERERAGEQIQIGTDIRAWEEHESPYALVASILKDRKAALGRLGMGETMPFVFDSLTGSSSIVAERHAAFTLPLPLRPNCATNPGSTRKKRAPSKKPSLTRL